MRERGQAVSEPSEGGGGAHPRGFQLGGPKKEEGRRRAGRAGKERGAGQAGPKERREIERATFLFSFLFSHFKTNFKYKPNRT